MKRATPRTKADAELEAIYAEIPSIPGCTGACASACGPIVMFEKEWKRVARSFGRAPRMRDGFLRCPMLSPADRCMVYTVRPYICRLWGTIKEMECPEGCEPERWLTRDEARDIFVRLRALAGPDTDGPIGPASGEFWETFALEARAERQTVIERIRQAKEQQSNG